LHLNKISLLKNLIYFSAAFLAGMVTCMAQNKKGPQPTHNMQSALLWKISGKGLSAPSYILGTIHLICHDDFLWTAEMQKAFDNAKKVVFEMDVDDPDLQKEISSGLMMQDGKSLKDLLSKQEYAQLEQFSIDSLGMPLDMMQNMKPFALMSLLSMKALNCTLPESYEGNIAAMAAKAGKEILGLETAADQLGVIATMNIDSSAKQLMEVINNYDSVQIQYNQLLDAYKSQNLPELYNLILAAPDFKNDLGALLFERNKKWIPGIEKKIRSGPAFIAVGAGHLWGKQGVLQLLREHGYHIDPLR
jgi:uncharacterized protein YbaP (TraB family)